MVKAPIQRDQYKRNPYKGVKPLLRVSEAEKTANDFEHVKDVADYYIGSTYFQDSTGQKNSNYRDLYVLYNVYNNVIPEEYFNYVTNPLNSSKKAHQAFPAKIRPYNIIRTNCDLLFGEFDKRPKNYTVWVSDGEAMNNAEEQVYKIILDNLQQRFVNKVNEMGGETGVESQQVELPTKLKAKFLSNYKDERAIWGQVNLEEIDHDVQTTEQFARMFKDYVIAGECYSLKKVHKGKISYERVSPMDVDYDKSPDARYIEDASWICRRKYVLPSDVVSQFYEELSAKQIDKMEDQDVGLPFTTPYFNTLFGNTYRKEEDLKRSKLTMYHVCFKFYKKLGILTSMDPISGKPQLTEVDENYKADAALGESIEWMWVPEWWETHRIDTPDAVANPKDNQSKERVETIYLGTRRIPEQRSQEFDFGYCKGPYNGIRFSDVHSRNTSIVELGLPYQIMYIILHYRLELALAKSKGKIALLDINTIPNTKGWDEEKFFYWSEANGFALLNRNQLGVDKGWNQYQVLDLSLFEHIANLIKIMDYVRSEWDQLVGFTPQRKGQVAASETASGVDAARYQSSVISERLFQGFDEFIRTERQGLLDLSKFTDLVGRRAIHYGDDMQSVMLEIDPARYTETVFNIHVSNSSSDLEDVQTMKQQAANFAAQGSKPSVIAEILQAKNISKLKGILKAMEAEEMEHLDKQAQSEQAIEAQKMEVEKQYREIEYTFSSLLQKEKLEGDKELAHIKGQYDLADTNTPGDSLDPLALEEQMLKREEMLRKSQAEREKIMLEHKKLQDEKEMHAKDLQMKKYDADTKLKIAKENKTKAELAKKKSSSSSSKKK